MTTAGLLWTSAGVPSASFLPKTSAADSFIGKHQLRLTADHRAGHFLRRLTQIGKSRVLITTRLTIRPLTLDDLDAFAAIFARRSGG